jgi:uncharacterized radical SAM protein YgiQ
MHFLPITQKEINQLGWDSVDVLLVSGDAYIDHPSFGAAIIGRLLELEGLRVAIVPQPNWQDDLRDFKKFGKPNLFFGVTAGNMDSMVNHYTANKRLRSNDAYTPGGAAGFRPDYATIIYSKIIKSIYPDVPIVLGGVEASMRRLSHYDYWSDELKPSILVESGADLLVYGMGEKTIIELANQFKSGFNISNITHCKQIAFTTDNISTWKNREDVILLHPHESELKSKKCYAENFVVFETESNKLNSKTLIQQYGNRYVVINPPHPPATEQEMDRWALFDHMQNAPHPKYRKRGEIPAFEMIKNSITIHRGCFGGCSFCTISAHQGKFIASRSEESVMREVKDLTQRPYFKGHISDLGGPSANMYKMRGKDEQMCTKCKRPSCLHPSICKNLDINHKPLLALYRKVREMNGVKQITIGSGIRYEMLVSRQKEIAKANGLTEYVEEVIRNHVSGRLKIAPEHTVDHVVNRMRKPSFRQFTLFFHQFTDINKKLGKNQQLIPYFMSAHPDCRVEEMNELSKEARKQRLITDQVQEFTPTPMTYSTAMFYLGFDPYTGEKIFVEKNIQRRKDQHLFFFRYKKENQEVIRRILRQMGTRI